MIKFAVILKEERLFNKLTTKQMAEILNISLWTYQNYETQGKKHAEPDQALLVKIAKVLDVSTDYLLGLED